MERLGNNRPSGIHAGALKTWGMVFVMAGILGRGLLQNRLLGVGSVDLQQLLELMQASEGAMAMATVALILQAMETCGVPIFAFCLVEGFHHTSNWLRYLLRLLALALVAELPYNLAIHQKLLAFGSVNPVFGLVISLLALWMYRQFAGKKLVCILVAVAAALWCGMLGIEHGVPVLLIVTTLWIFRKKPALRGFAGCAAAVLCSVSSIFYLAAPMSFLAIHMYNGEPGEQERLISYLFYPVALLAVGLVAKFLF